MALPTPENEDQRSFDLYWTTLQTKFIEESAKRERERERTEREKRD